MLLTRPAHEVLCSVEHGFLISTFSSSVGCQGDNLPVRIILWGHMNHSRKPFSEECGKQKRKSNLFGMNLRLCQYSLQIKRWLWPDVEQFREKNCFTQREFRRLVGCHTPEDPAGRSEVWWKKPKERPREENYWTVFCSVYHRTIFKPPSCLHFQQLQRC